MSRETFMKELEYLLQDIGEEERSDALSYYGDYLDEAGPEKEEEVLKEFGSPERVAALVRAGLNGSMENRGEFTESGYGDEKFRDPRYQVQRRLDLPERQAEKREKGTEESRRRKDGASQQKQEKGGENRVLKLVLWALLIIVAAPVVFGVGSGVLSLAAGIGITIFAVFFCAALGAVGCLLAGIAAMAGGVVYMFADFLGGGMTVGIGLLLIGIGLLLLVLSVWFYGKLVPAVFRSVIDWCNRLVHGGRRRA